MCHLNDSLHVALNAMSHSTYRIIQILSHPAGIQYIGTDDGEIILSEGDVSAILMSVCTSCVLNGRKTQRRKCIALANPTNMDHGHITVNHLILSSLLGVTMHS